MTDRPSSGNRWEPDETAPLAAQNPSRPSEDAPPPTTSYDVQPAPPPATPAATPARRTLPRGRAALVAAGVALFLVAGLGGFVAGHAVGGRGGDQQPDIGTPQDGGPGTPPGFDHDHDGRGPGGGLGGGPGGGLGGADPGAPAPAPGQQDGSTDPGSTT